MGSDVYFAQRVCTWASERAGRFSRLATRLSKQYAQCACVAMVGWWGEPCDAGCGLVFCENLREEIDGVLRIVDARYDSGVRGMESQLIRQRGVQQAQEPGYLRPTFRASCARARRE